LKTDCSLYILQLPRYILGLFFENENTHERAICWPNQTSVKDLVWTGRLRSSCRRVSWRRDVDQPDQDLSPCYIKYTVWKHSQNRRDYMASNTVRVFSRQGDRFTLSRMELLTSRKKQIRHGDQVLNKTINAMAESKQHCEGV
jgi:hypothetical protein